MATPGLNPSHVVVDLEKGMGGRRDTAAVAPPKKKIILPNKMTTTTSDDANSMNGLIGMALVGLYLYYIFFVFYMVATCEKWWHAALAIGIATAFLVLSFCLAAMQSNKPPSSSRKIQPQDTTQTDLGTRLLA
uniref:Transmembrane protein n=1 Tax=Oryza punctata TaxID=4537 RepID=A0A0E0MHU7_ORYPU